MATKKRKFCRKGNFADLCNVLQAKSSYGSHNFKTGSSKCEWANCIAWHPNVSIRWLYYFMINRGFSNVSEDGRPVFQTVLVYDLVEKKYLTKITGTINHIFWFPSVKETHSFPFSRFPWVADPYAGWCSYCQRPFDRIELTPKRKNTISWSQVLKTEGGPSGK